MERLVSEEGWLGAARILGHGVRGGMRRKKIGSRGKYKTSMPTFSLKPTTKVGKDFLYQRCTFRLLRCLIWDREWRKGGGLVWEKS